MATTAPTLFLVMMDCPAEIESEFNEWYDKQHVPNELLKIPGFLSAHRYRAIEGSPGYQALYDLTGPDVLERPEFRALGDNPSEMRKRVLSRVSNLHRRTYTQLSPAAAETPPQPEKIGGLLLVGLKVAPEHDEEFNAWYNTEHLPFLAAVPGVLRARRFAPNDNSGEYLAVYELADPDVPNTDAWAKAANTPWTFRHRPRFDRWLRIRSRALVPAWV